MRPRIARAASGLLGPVLLLERCPDVEGHGIGAPDEEDALAVLVVDEGVGQVAARGEMAGIYGAVGMVGAAVDDIGGPFAAAFGEGGGAQLRIPGRVEQLDAAFGDSLASFDSLFQGSLLWRLPCKKWFRSVLSSAAI